jgi:hypothetical protein
MPTDEQRKARSANARLSHGPKTPAGKAASSQNAVKFGFFTRRHPVLPGESEDDYLDFRTKLIASLDPVGGMECMLAENLVTAAWRLRRFPLVETGLFTVHLCDDQAEFASESSLYDLDPSKESYAGEVVEVEALQASNAPENALGRAFLHDARNEQAFSRLSRYETSIRRSFQRDLAALRQMQEQRASGAEKPFLQNDLTEGLNALPLAS